MSTRAQLALLVSTLVLAAPVGAQAKHRPYQHVPDPVAEGAGGAAATVDSVATDAALEVLKRNGNAVDAAVAAAAVLGVTEPFSSGVGGGGFMVIRTPNGKVTTIDGARGGAGGDDLDRVRRSGHRPAAPVRRRALQRAVGRRAGHGGDVGHGAWSATARGR